MGHIHTKPGEHDHTASAFIVNVSSGEPKIILHMHKKLHKLLQFGGHIETLETPWQAVTHEILEESGYEMSQLKILQPKGRLEVAPGSVVHPAPIYHQTHPFSEDHFHTDVAYAFVTTEEPLHPVADDELGLLREFTRQELVELPDDEIFESVRSACIYVFDVCLPEWEQLETSTFV